MYPRQTPMRSLHSTRSNISRSSSNSRPTSLPFPDMVSRRTVVRCSWFQNLVQHIRNERDPRLCPPVPHGFPDENYSSCRAYTPYVSSHPPSYLSQALADAHPQAGVQRIWAWDPLDPVLLRKCKEPFHVIFIDGLRLRSPWIPGKN